MGHPKFARPKYDTPPHPWKADRIEEEHAISNNHGLKNMTEIWKAKSQLRRHRRQAMKLIGRVDTSEGHFAREKDAMLRSLHNKGLITSDAILDDILALSAEDILNRRLQAQVYYKGLASSMKEARQLVVHGHICLGKQKVTIPSYQVTREDEELICYHPRSPLNNENHTIRQNILGLRESAEYAEDEVDPEFTQEEATKVNEAAADAPKAEDSVPKGGDE
ncbi:MAG: 30S ribosomal protein S4 [Candidatus Poseidoniaceae archaeon]|jgi:small subunit ribosomal protein S4|nr:30S ribosomal protein S4 [Candidatus Poseidoniaceae archaeon]